MSIRRTIFIAFLILPISTIFLSNTLDAQRGLVNAHWSSKLKANLYTTMVYAGNTIKAHPKKIAAAITGITSLGGILLYKKNKAMQKYVRRTQDRISETYDNVYYDVLDTVFTPVFCEWDELQGTPFTVKDAAYVGAGVGSLYGIAKLNQTYQISDKVKTMVGQNVPLIATQMSHARNSLHNSFVTTSQKISGFYAANKTNTHIVMGLAAAGLLGYALHKAFDATENSYIKLLPPFWSSFIPEQLQLLEQDHLELVIRAQDNPTELLSCDRFMKLLTEKQSADLEKIIMKYTEETKQLKELIQ